MEFYAYKIIQALLLPPSLLLEGLILCLALLQRQHTRAAKRVLVSVGIGYYILSINTGASFLGGTLERNITPKDVPTDEIEAIVILGGGASSSDKGSEFVELGESSRARLNHGMKLYREYNGSLPIFYSGGSGDPSVPISYEAQSAQVIAESHGIPKHRFFIESGSRTTAENATAVREWLRDQFPHESRPTVILVTSSWHMRRAMAVFATLGMTVIPGPVFYKEKNSQRSLLEYIPSESGFASSTQSIHEWMGILGYRLIGWIQ